jgi:agmatine/peptidylarginine deiminase
MSTKSSNILYPAEWYPQSAVQLTWPDYTTDWADILTEVEECYSNVAYEICKRQLLLIACSNPVRIHEKLSRCNQQNLRLVQVPVNDTWARDHGGITVLEDGKPVILDFTFNGWGMKFAANHDNQITRQLYENGIFEMEVALLNMKKYVLEGGSIESDGLGTILTTEECLLEPNRNSWMDKQSIEELLKSTFGASRVLWLKNGFLAGDDTDSHVDTLARFCSESSIAYVKCDDKQDEHFAALKAMEDELKAFKTHDGNPYQLIPLPMAEPVFDGADRLPATYANFLIINGAVLVPTYNTKTDAIALKQLSITFPERDIIGIDCSALIKQHGSLHCISMQYPEGVVS